MPSLPSRPLRRSFRVDRRGNFATIFAFCLVPLLGFAGLATDFAKSNLVKRRMDVAIDAASLAALNTTVGLINEGKSTDAAAIAAGEAEGRRYLIAQASAVLDGRVAPPTVKIRRDGSTLTSTVTYSAEVPTVFSRLYGQTEYEIGGRSAASVTLPPFYDIHVLVDISGSMGIGATTADQEILKNMIVTDRWGGQYQYDCSFACHIMRPQDSESTYTSGKSAGATMRIDVVRSALRRVAQRLLNDPTKRYRLAIYTMHSQTTQLIGLSDDLSSVTTAINGGVQLASNLGGTNFHVALGSTNGVKIPKPGDGLTQKTAKSALIFMTDGVEDTQMEEAGIGQIIWDPDFVYFSPFARDGGGWIQPIDPKLCDPFKKQGTRVIAMNTNYIVPDPPENVKFEAIRDWMHVNIKQNMEKCVSSKADYHDASSPSEINKAMNDIINSISKPIALTQ